MNATGDAIFPGYSLAAAAVGLATGIAVGYFWVGLSIWYPAMIVAMLVTLVCVFFLWRKFFVTTLAALLCAGVGGLLVRVAIPVAPEIPDDYGVLTGRIEAVYLLTDSSFDYDLADVVMSWGSDHAIELPGKTRVRGILMKQPALPGQWLRVKDIRVWRPEGQRNPGGFDARLYALTNGYSYSGDSRGTAWAIGEYAPIRSAFLRARLDAITAIDRLWPLREENAIIRGLVLGTSSLLDDEERAAFSKLGIAHVLAVSGLHVGFVLLLIQGVLRLIFYMVPRRYAYLWGELYVVRALLSMLGLLFYAVVIGFGQSVTRALIMAGVGLMANILRVRYDAPAALSTAVLVMLIRRPLDLFSVSFQMSVGAVMGIFLLRSIFRSGMERWRVPRPLAGPLSISVSAQMGILPILARNYNSLPLLGLLANFFAVPLAGVVTMLGIPLIALEMLFPSVGFVVAYPVALCARLLSRLALSAAQFPFVSVMIPSPTPMMMMVFWLLLFLCSPVAGVILGKMKHWFCVGAAGWMIVAFALWMTVVFPVYSVVTVLDVGQGHSSIVRLGTTAVVVDAGNTAAAANAAVYYGLRYDVAILTHGDKDHASMLPDLIADGHVKLLCLPKGCDNQSEYIRACLEAAQEVNIPFRYLAAGDILTFGGLRISVCAPLPWREETGDNAYMLVASIGTAKGEAFFTGDLTEKAERDIEFPVARVLQIAHHGSSYATSAGFLEVVRPEVAVIPVGENTYGHPGEGLLRRLMDHGVRIERTDLSGAIQIEFRDELRITRWAGEEGEDGL